mgnify:FL=1
MDTSHPMPILNSYQVKIVSNSGTCDFLQKGNGKKEGKKQKVFLLFGGEHAKGYPSGERKWAK